jgi:acyl-ACP thioesterase
VNRRFTNGRKVRLGDVDPNGRLRLDALARYLQDVANDDAVDAGEHPSQPWVVRKVALALEGRPRLHERVELATWCSGVGARWAERSTSVESPSGRVTATTLWVFVDVKTLLPARLPPNFFDIWGQDLPKVRGRLSHDDPPESGVAWRPWPLRAVDHDILDHMNNAAYWVPVEEAFAGADLAGTEIEYRVPVNPGQALDMGLDGDRMWLRGGDGTVHASVVVRRA